jgi:soluble lytic murein transglycosylase-like protein
MLLARAGLLLVSVAVSLALIGVGGANTRDLEYLAILGAVIKATWPDADPMLPPTLAGQVETESGWNPAAKNPHSTAYGLGQQLKGTWIGAGYHLADRKNPTRQVELLVLIDHRNWDFFDAHLADGEWRNRAAFMLAAYNAGLGGVLAIIHACHGKKSCNPRLWFGQAEMMSGGPRGYVRAILMGTMQHYDGWVP